MRNNVLIDDLMEQLRNEGVMPPVEDKVVENDPNDRDEEIIRKMERVTGKKYSDEQLKILRHKGNACILACAGSGKALVNGTKVLTINGYKPIESLVIGDRVFDENGNVQEVIGIFPQGYKKTCIVKFNTGEKISCCNEHLWTIKNVSGYWQTFNTKELMNRLKQYNNKLEIPNNRVYDVSSESNKEYFNALEDMMPSKDILVDMIKSEDNKTFRTLLDKIDDKISTVGIMFELYKLVEDCYSLSGVIRINVENEALVDCIRTAFDFFGTPVIIEKKIGSSIISFDNFMNKDEIGKRYIVDIEETDKLKKMTCIKVTGKSQLFMIENNICTHNTTISTHLIVKRILTGEIRNVNRMIYTTYSKAGATEMKDRLDKLLMQMGLDHIDVEVKTLHSFFLKVLRIFGIGSAILSAEDRPKLIRQACKDADFLVRDDDLMIVDNLLSYQVNNLMSDRKTLDSPANTLEDLTLDKYALIRKSYTVQKKNKGVIDYDDMQSMLYLWLVKYGESENAAERDTAKSVRDYCKNMWQDFYIDEAQDVSKIQFSIIRAMVENPDEKGKLDRGLVFIGDDDQCIYQWRGSDPSIILSIGATFNMNTFVLSTNYRCYNEIVDYATTGIRCNSSRYNKGMQAYSNGGSVKIIPSIKRDLCSLSILAVQQIKEWIEKGDDADNIAVLSRNNFHLAILNNMLLREGIYCNATNDMKLTKSYMYKDIKDIITLSTEACWKGDMTSRILWKLCRYMGAGPSSFIGKFQETNYLTFEDTLGYLIKHYINKNVDFNKKVNVNIQEESKIILTMNRLGDETREDMTNIYLALKSQDKEETLKVLLYNYLNATGFMYKSADKNRSITGLVQYIINLSKKDGIDKMKEFLRVTEQLEYGNMAIQGPKVTLTTIHSAKGREWKNVIMFGCDNVSMPNVESIACMVTNGALDSDINDYIDEERRLFYVGNTRAKENLLVITYENPSYFVMESLGMFGNSVNEGKDNNSEIIKFSNTPDLASELNKDFIMKMGDKDNKYSKI